MGKNKTSLRQSLSWRPDWILPSPCFQKPRRRACINFSPTSPSTLNRLEPHFDEILFSCFPLKEKCFPLPKKQNKQNQRNKQHDESHRTLTMKLYVICMYDAYIHTILCMNQCYRAFHTHTKYFASIQREIVCYVLEVADGREIHDRIMTRGKRLKNT